MKSIKLITSLFTGNQILKHIYEIANELAESLLNHQCGIVFYMDDKKMKAVWCYNVYVEGMTLVYKSQFLQNFELGVCRVMIIDKQSALEYGLSDLVEIMGFEKALVAPLVVNGKLKGIWILSWRQNRIFSDNELLIMETLAANLSLNIQSILIGSENLKLRQETKAIYEINREISMLADLNLTLDNITEKTCSLLQASSCYVALADEEKHTLQIKVNYTTRGEAWRTWAYKYHPVECQNTRLHGYTMRWQDLIYHYGEGVGGLTAQQRTSQMINNFRQYIASIKICIPEILATGGVVSSICVPMCTKRGLVGILCAVSSKDNAFNRTQLKMMETMGNQAAIAIENSHYYTEQKKLTRKLQTNINIHGRLLDLVLSNKGMQAVCDTLSELINLPVIIQDKDCKMLCWSTKGYENIPFDKLKQLLNDCLFQRESFSSKKEAYVTETIIVPESNNSTAVTRVDAPIIGGESKFGYVSVIAVNKALNDQQRIALEETTIVLALEFLRQEAARAGLLHHVITAQEEERKRIARELHDETSQTITAIMLGLDTIALEISPQKAPPRLFSTKALAEDMLDNIHRIISDLRPSVLDDLGLLSAITWLGDQRLTPLGIEYTLKVDGLEDRLPPSMEVALYRIIQEALTNVIRHAEAKKVDILVDKNSELLFIEIRDNGKGFNLDVLKNKSDSNKGLGLWGMQERVRTLDGKMTIDTAIDQGTTISIRLPL